MNSYISISDVLQLMRIGRKADIVVCSFDRNRKTGGERLSYKNVIMREVAAKPTVSGIVSVVSPSIASEARQSEKARMRNPHHRFNKTINIQTISGDIITIHPVLIEEFNGQRVVL